MDARRQRERELALRLLADPGRIRRFAHEVARGRHPDVPDSGRSADDIGRALLADPERIRLVAEDVVRERHGRGRR